VRDIGIIKGVAIVFLFWWSVIYISVNGVSAVYLAIFDFIESIQIVIIGALVGVSSVLAYEWLNEMSIKSLHPSSVLRGMKVTIGKFPTGSVPPPGGKKTGNIFLNHKLNEWFADYEKKYPLHAELFRSVAGILHHYHKLPASPIPGGHGNLTLIQHSENVLLEMLARSSSWKYIGHVGKSGKVLVQPIDGTWQYEKELMNSPILPLIAYAHDIGKVECYVPHKKHVKEVRKGHDMVGKQIIIRLDEYWNLPPKDREIISMSMCYYHHIGSLPLWCDDSIRAATELLIFVDMETGRKEGGAMTDYEEYTSNDPNAEFSSLAASMSDDDIGEAMSNIKDSVSKLNDITEIPIDDAEVEPVRNEAPVQPVAAPVKLNKPAPLGTNHDAQVEWMFEVFCNIISETGRINGKDPKRIGFKKNGKIYLNDADWRNAAAKELGNEDVAKIENGQINTATYLVLEALKKRGKLYCIHEGYEYSTKRALFKIQSFLPVRSKKALLAGTKGDPGTLWSHAMVFNADAIPSLNGIADTDGEFEIMQASWGPSSALNKANGPKVVASASDEPEKAPVVDSSVDGSDSDGDSIDENVSYPEPKSKAQEVFANLRKQHLQKGVSDIPFSIETHKDKVLQVVRLDLLSTMHPEIDWTMEVGFVHGKDKNKNRVCCLVIEEGVRDV